METDQICISELHPINSKKIAQIDIANYSNEENSIELIAFFYENVLLLFTEHMRIHRMIHVRIVSTNLV